MKMIEKGLVSVGLVGRRISTDWADYHSFAKDRLVLVVPARHPWKKNRSVKVDDFCAEPLILREQGSGTRACLEQALNSQHLTVSNLNIALELGSNEAIKDAVIRGLGVAVLSIHAVKQELSKRRLFEVSIEGLTLTRDLYVVTDRRRAVSVSAHAFLSFLHTRPVDDVSS
jgi:DNA-binding transcriptional LysR family regulator